MSQQRRALYLSDTHHAVDGDSRANPPGLFEQSIPDLFAQILRIVCGYGVAVIDGMAAKLIGLPTDTLPTGPAAKGHPVAATLRDAGFKVREISRWFHVKHDDHGQAWFALADFLDVDHFPMLDDDRGRMTAALAEWHRLAGVPWHGGAGDAGNAILRTCRYRSRGKDRPAEWWSWTGPDDVIESPYLPTQWVRPHPGIDTAYGYDRVRAYLAAMTCTEVAAEPLEHRGAITFDPKRSGWWLVELGPWDFHHLMPDPAGYSPDETTKGPRVRWVTTPTLRLLTELKADEFYDFRVLDSWTAPSTAIVKTYAARLRDVWDGTAGIEDPEIRKLVRAGAKGAYHLGHGYMRSRQSDVQRPDWAAAITATSRANLWRKCWTLGQADGTWQGPWPMWIDTDNVFYPGLIRRHCDWTIWSADRDDLDDVTKLGHWRTGGTHDVSRETGYPVSRKRAEPLC